MKRLITITVLAVLALLSGCASSAPSWPTAEMRACKQTVVDPDGTVHHFDALYSCSEFKPVGGFPKRKATARK